ncbi:MAG TPA: peptidoglycan-binding domain-containing protein [Azospirillum sp.]|nr:peptidoglycan-binding domain-containing protein [Azospirillum sp.]
MKELVLFTAIIAAGMLAAPAMAQSTAQQGQQNQAGGAQITASPAQVRQVQQVLKQSGYNAGNVNGSWDQQTSQAVRNFQQAQGLEPTGQLNTRTLSALGISGNSGVSGGTVGGTGSGSPGGASGAGNTGAAGQAGGG